MPTLTRWYIKTSFIYFILALGIGVLIGIQALKTLSASAVDLLPPYFHLLAEGWITMLIIGVASWMFPKFTLEQPRGNEGLGWASYILLNTGLVLRVVSEPVVGSVPGNAKAWVIVLVIAAILQWLGGIAFVVNTWGRAKVK